MLKCHVEDNFENSFKGLFFDVKTLQNRHNPSIILYVFLIYYVRKKPVNVYLRVKLIIEKSIKGKFTKVCVSFKRTTL